MYLLSKVLTFGIWPALPLTGYLIFSLWLHESRTAFLSKITSISLMTVTGIAAWSIPLLISAMVGVYRAEYFGLLGWAITLIALIRLLRKPNLLSQISFGISKWDFLLLCGLIASAYFYLAFPSESIYLRQDEGLYANHGIYIANHGRLDVVYPWPDDLDQIFHKGFKEIPGLYLTKSSMTVQFAHLLPVWLAQAFSTFDYHGLFRLNAIFALLSLCIFYSLCRSIIPKGYAVIVTLFLAFNASQLWMARITLTEILTQLFIWSGLLALLVAHKNGKRRVAILAGIILGFSSLVRIDSFLLVPLIFLGPVIQQIADEKHSRELLHVWLSFFIGALPIFFLALAYYIFLSTPYFLALSSQLKLIGILGYLSFFLFLISIKSKRWKKVRQIMIYKKNLFLIITGFFLVVFVIYAYFIRPYWEPYSLINNPGHILHGTRDYRENSLVNLSTYLSIPVIFIGVFGFFLTIWKVFQKQNLDLAPVMICFAGFSALYLWNPLISPFHFWAIRRFVPVVIPGFIFFAVTGMWVIMNRQPNMNKFLKSTVLAIVVVYLIFFTIKTNKLILFFSENKGSFSQFIIFAEKLSANTLILSKGGPASHSWIAPLYMAFDRKVVPLNFDVRHGAFALYRYSANQSKEQRPAYILLDEHIQLTGLQLVKIDEVILSRDHTELTPFPLPKKIASEQKKIILYKIAKIDPVFYNDLGDDDKLLDTLAEQLLNRDLGNEKVLGTNESGFYGQEFHGDRPFRWTDGHAKLIVRLSRNKDKIPKALSVTIGEIEGIVDKDLKILANNYVLFEGKISSEVHFDLLPLSKVPMVEGERLTVELISNTHAPSGHINGSPDHRKLGVPINGIKLLDEIPVYTNINLGAQKILHVWESGFHEQEVEGDKPFRWTDGHGKLKMLIDQNRFPITMSVKISAPGGGKDKNLRIFANGKELFKGKISNADFSHTFSLSGIPKDDQLVIELLSDTHIPSQTLKRSNDNRRLGVMVKEIRLLDAMPDFINQDIGNRTVRGVGESGFYAQEFIGGRPVRWTNGVSKLMVPLDPKRIPRALMVNIEMTGTEKKMFKILVNKHELFHGQIPAVGWSKIFNLSGLRLRNQATIELLSDTHVPKETIRGSEDTRALGVLLGNIRLLNRLPDYLDVTLGARKAPGIGEQGFHGQEFIGDMPVRWTDGAARLEILMDRRRPPKALTVDIESTGGVSEKDSKILINGYILFEGKIPDRGWTQTFDLSGIPLKDQIVIELLSDTHIPCEIIQGYPDTRKLGVMVKGVKLLEDYQLE